MKYEDLINSLQQVGKDPSRLIFEDELTGIHNRRFLLNYFEYKVSWDTMKDNPLSLLMMDIDHFKKFNDLRGHHCGDQALTHIARLLKEVAGERSMPIRYAGDEFMILMPKDDKGSALEVGDRLLQRVRSEPLHLEEGTSLPISLSIGIASAPDDAKSGKDLIQKADAALYYAKKTGRDCLANAAAIDPQVVFGKSALHLLGKRSDKAGRRAEFERAAESFRKFEQHHSQLLIIEGAAGMGKTTFLNTIRETLVQDEIKLVKVNGIKQEGYRPYYLATNIMVELLNQRKDGGAEIFSTLSQKEIAYLANILPQLEGSQDTQLQEDDATQREGLFSTLVNFIMKLVDFRSLVVLIDDVQYADEGVLHIFRQLMQRHEISLFLCGTSMDFVSLQADEEEVPFERFYATYHHELSIGEIVLKPLTATDIGNHLQGLFPQITVPEGFEQNLAEVSQGNPLFLGEILRKLVMDQKIMLSDQRWIIRRLEDGYLPRSLDEIVSQKIVALDGESRKLLDQASTFGEDVSLSYLTGSSEKKEAKVLEFVDQAVALGLLSSDFEHNDETIRFLSKRVHEIIYGGIQQDQKKILHERIGNYQENLYLNRLLPSASYLAYHFKRSADQEKAKTYEKKQMTYNTQVFNVQEATTYSGDQPDEAFHDTPLDPISLPHIPDVIRSLQTAVRNMMIYPPGSKTVSNTTAQLMEAINKVLASNERLSILQSKQTLLVNGQEIDMSEYKFVVESFLVLLNSVELKGLSFHRGLAEEELKKLLEAFGHIKQESIDQHFWERFSANQSLMHINLRQLRYTERGKSKKASSQVFAEQKLGDKSIIYIPETIRYLQSITRNINLYPLNSQTIKTSIQQFMAVLSSLLDSQPSLTIALARNSLIVNGDRIDTSEYKSVADGFLEFLQSIGIRSITFVRHVSTAEVETFIGALREPPATGFNLEYWRGFARDNRISNIFFDERLYEVKVASTLKEIGEDCPAGEGFLELSPADAYEGRRVEQSVEVSPETDLIEQFAKESFHIFLGALPERVNNFLLHGDTKLLQKIIERLFIYFKRSDSMIREMILNSCRTLLESIPPGFKQDFIKLIVYPLLLMYSEEKDSKILVMEASFLHRMGADLIQFSEYLMASRIFVELQNRRRQLKDTKDVSAINITKSLKKKLDQKTQRLLMDDLKSGESERQQDVVKLLGTLGTSAEPMLIDLIKQEEDIQVRQIAAGLLAELGPKTAEALKSELVLEITPEERFRILEVIDIVTRSLESELAFVLGDDNPKIRQAAFRLAERLNNKQVIKLLLDYARNLKTDLAISAIRCLGRIKAEGATEVLVSLLGSTKETEKAVACCKALGQIGDPESIKPLAKILTAKGFFLFYMRNDPEVRAATAYALKQIPHPQVAEVFIRLTNDRDPRVRQIARSFNTGL